jgi:CDP-paratose 2-epimerase
MFWHFYNKPRTGEVYNAGGGRYSNCSIVEGIELCQKISGNILEVNYSDENRIGDHIWWISDTSKFQNHFPSWSWSYNLEDILIEIFDGI